MVKRPPKRRVDAIVETLIYLVTESRRVTKGMAREFGLTGPQLTVIKLLEELGDLSLSSLSARIKARNSTVTGIVDRMEREDLVVREQSQEDRRVTLIRLTDRGRALADRIEVEPMAIFRRALESLAPDDLETLFRILEQLHHHVRQAVESSPTPPPR